MNNEKHNYSLGIHIYHEKKSKKKWFGLKQKVALKEAVGCMMMSAIVLFVKFGSIDVNLLVLVPVIYVMLAFNISSLAALISGTVLVWAVSISSLYIYILQLILDASGKFWIGYILNFFFTFILYSIMAGRRWINLFACKMMLIDLICVVYFNQGISPYVMIWQFYVLFCLVFCVIIFCGIFLFPWLATRIFMTKSIKTLKRTNQFFRAVGYQMEVKLDMESGKISPTPSKRNENNNNNNNNNNNTNNNNNNNNNSNNNSELHNKADIKKSKSFIHPIYSPEYMSYVDADDNNNNDNVNNVDINLENINNNITSSHDNHHHHHRHRHHFKSQAQVTTICKIPTKEELLEMEGKLGDQIFRLSIILGECKLERWNATLVSQYEVLLALLEVSQKQLITIKLSIDEGFEIKTKQEMILPMLPFIDSIIEEVHLQISLMVDILESTEKFDWEAVGNNITSKTVLPADIDLQSIKYKKKVLEMSFEETDELIITAKEFYKNCVKEYQRADKLVFHEEEISKVHFYLIGIFSFASSQKRISEVVFNVKKHQRQDYIIFELLRYGVWFILTAFPLHVYKRIIKIKNLIKFEINEKKTYDQKKNEASGGDENKPIPTIVKFWRFTIAWFWNTFFDNRRWVFPLQVAIGFTSTIAIFNHFNGRKHGELTVNGMWTCITTVIVFSPSLGATATRAIHRMMGTIAGGFIGFLVSWLTSIINNEGKEVVLFICTFIWIFSISHIQQDPRYSYAGSVSGLTFIMVSYGQYLSRDHTVMYAVMRCLFITMGIVWVLILSLVIFPFFTYKSSTEKSFKSASSITTTFITILENSSLMLYSSSQQQSLALQLPNQIAIDILPIQQQPDNNQAIMTSQDNNLPIQQDADTSIITSALSSEPISSTPSDSTTPSSESITSTPSSSLTPLSSTPSSSLTPLSSTPSVQSQQSQQPISIISSQSILSPPTPLTVLEPEQYRTQLVTSLRGIRVLNGQILASLVDIKSEYFFKPYKIKNFFKIHNHLTNLNTRLSMSHSILSKELGEKILNEMLPVNRVLELIIQDLKKLNDNYNAIITDKPTIHSIEPNILNERVQELIGEVHNIRVSLLQRKIIYELYPDMIQFGASIFIIIDFIKYHIITYNHLLKLKSNNNNNTKTKNKKKKDNLKLKNIN